MKEEIDEIDDYVNFSFTKSDCKSGSYQPSSRQVASSTSAYIIKDSSNLTMLFEVKEGKKITINVPTIDGVNYKYRYGYYDSNKSRVSQIDSTTDNYQTQKTGCSYIAFGVYAYNSDGSNHENILDDYSDGDIISVSINQKVQLNRLIKENAETAKSDLESLESELNEKIEEIDPENTKYVFSKSDLVIGSYQASSKIVTKTSYDEAFSIKKTDSSSQSVKLFKIQSGKKFTVSIPEIDGVSYKYRFGFYDSNETLTKQIESTTENTTEQISGSEYIAFGVYAYNEDGTPHNNIYNYFNDSDIFSVEIDIKQNLIQLISDTKEKLLAKRYRVYSFLKSELTMGSLQPIGGYIAKSYTTCYGYNSKLKINPGERVMFTAPTVDGIYYKYRIGFYDDKGTYVKMIEMQSANYIVQPSDCYYIMIGVYAYNLSDDSAHENIMDDYVDTDILKLETTNTYIEYIGEDDARELIKENEINISNMNKNSVLSLQQIIKPINTSSNGYKLQYKPLVILHFSDLHGDSVELSRIVSFYDDNSKYFNDVMCSGDFVADRWDSDFNFWSECKADKFLLSIGNHDILTDTNPGYDWTKRATELATYNRYFAPYIGDWGVIYTEGKTYYYKDYTASNVRMIVINNMLEGDDETAQLTWLSETLSSANASGYTVFIVSHFPPHDFAKITCNFSVRDKTFSDGELTSAYLDIVNSFIVNGGKFACWLCGHTHNDYIGYSSTYPDQLCVVIDAASREQCIQYSDVMRVDDTKSEDLFNAFCIDVSSQIIKLVRFGVNSNRYTQPRNTFCINYADKTIISQY